MARELDWRERQLTLVEVTNPGWRFFSPHYRTRLEKRLAKSRAQRNQTVGFRSRWGSPLASWHRLQRDGVTGFAIKVPEGWRQFLGTWGRLRTGSEEWRL